MSSVIVPCIAGGKRKTTVFECAVHEKCLPSYRNDHALMTCSRCTADELGYAPREKE